MVCIYCKGRTKTTNSRARMEGTHTWRRRQCVSCKAVFTTDETVDLKQTIRVSKKKDLEPFLYEKLFLDVYGALSHRKTAYMDAKSLTDTIILKLLPCKSGMVSGNEIKGAASEVLKRFDKAASTYFKAHHPIS